MSRAASADRMKLGRPVQDGLDATSFSIPGSPAFQTAPPSPAITKNLLSALRTTPFSNISLTDFDPLELARQFTIMESRLYCMIRPEELLGQEFSKKSAATKAPNVKSMSALSTTLTGWVAEVILNEQDAKKRTQLLKYFIKVADVGFSFHGSRTC